MSGTEHKLAPAAPADDDDLEPTGLTGADPRLAPGYVHVDAGVHPDHGEPVVYTPGELLSDWLREALEAGGTLAVAGPGRFRLVPPKRRSTR